MKARHLVVLVLVAHPLLAATAWVRVVRKPLRAPSHAVVVFDRSQSVAEVACDVLPAVVRRALAAHGMRDGSELLVLGTGDPSTADEPIPFGRHAVRRVHRVLEGRDALAQQETALLRTLQAECRRVGTSTREPVLVAAMRAIEQLRAEGCGHEVPCNLFIVTDGEVPEVLAFMKAGTNKRLPDLRVDNGDITVTLCGIAQTRGTGADGHRLTASRDPARVLALSRAWRAHFTAGLSIEPFCDAESPVVAGVHAHPATK